MAASGRRLERKGVEAIFTSEREQRDARFLVGLSGVIAGIAFWVTLFLDSRYPMLFGTSEISSYLSMILGSFGLILVISGVGICRAFWIGNSLHDNDRADNNADPPLDSKSLHNPISSFQRPQAGIFFTFNFKLGLVSFVQGCIAISLFSGLADEYQSNVSMQQWVHAVFPLGRYLLNWEGALIVSAVFGLLVTQFLPRRALAE